MHMFHNQIKSSKQGKKSMEKPHTIGVGVGVRKGAWTKEEDVLLTKCIHKFGEGRWHLVPLRAGLNRCRKSCRLRWLNYLNPNVKRGLFTKDEVDLIVRMHKLLGNRWSLIAGRIPGRTANDIKNFWNTHIHKKSSVAVANETHQPTNNKATITECNTIRPQPRNLSRKLQHSPFQFTTSKTNQLDDDHHPSNLTGNEEIPTNKQPVDDNQLVPDEVEECMRWWAKLIDTSENDNGRTRSVPFSFLEDKAHQLMILSPGSGNHTSFDDIDGGLSSYDLEVDAMWELMNMDKYP